MGTLVRVLSITIAIGFNTLIFLMLFSRLSGTRAPWRRILRGALFGAVGFELLKLLATLLLTPIMRNPVYAPFAVTVGLLIWINLVSRFVLFAAAWTATRARGGATRPATITRWARLAAGAGRGRRPPRRASRRLPPGTTRSSGQRPRRGPEPGRSGAPPSLDLLRRRPPPP